MTRLPFVIASAVFVASALAAAQQTFRVGVDIVHFGVVVTDKHGKTITGLTADDFEVKEEGQVQTIKFFTAGDPAVAPPLHLGLLLDTSGSMETDMKDVRTAVIKFLNSIESPVDVTFVDFDVEVRAAKYAPTEYPRLIEKIRMRKPEGWTALFDALAVYLASASQQDGQKILVMYTDGGDTRSTTTLTDLLNYLRASDVTIYPIGYLENQRASDKMTQRMQMQNWADMTGGRAFFPYKLQELDKLYEEIRSEIASRYVLGYTSTDERTDGRWRKVDIKLKRPDLKGVKIRTREGYFAPYKPAK
jgi:Ca-activated chloride channel family protein